MRGLLDPAEVAGPAYFGNTAHSDDDMVSFVTQDLTDRDTWKLEDIEAVVVAMSAESGLRPQQTAADAKATEAALIAKGRALVSDVERCGSCHTFHDNGTKLGSAPDITGWGSRSWLVGIITDPTHKQFYGDTNDRMPSFGKADPGSVPILSTQQIELVVDWLRGDWYRPAVSKAAH